MRILAIRGENLASLYGPFELPLDRGSIAGAGIFSIAGATGSGKSTLLDALCLALYGKTPRLRDHAGGKKVMVGWSEDGELLDMNDARALVSRGAVSALAQVDYEGVDRRRYRASWRVHRARRKVEGALQAQAMTVEDLDTGEVLAEKVSQAVAENERAVGFTFDEFKRAVVLPQFEFTNFLRADADVRASILERVTGTDVYTRLSQAAHQRMARETAERARLEAEAGGLRVLGDAERAALVARRDALAGQLMGARQEVRHAAAEVAWHERAAALAREVADAEAGHARALADLEAGASRRAELAAVEAAEPHRGAHAEAERTARARILAEERARAAEDRLRDAAAARERRDEAERAGAAALAAAEGAEAAARPALVEARRLDHALAEARRAWERAAQEAARAKEEAAQAERAAAQAARARAEAEAARRSAEDWLLSRAAERALAAEWGRWEARLREHASATTDLARTEASLAAARTASAHAAEALAEAGAELERRGARAEAARATAAEAAAAAAALDRRALGEEARRLRVRSSALGEAVRAATDAARARARRDQARLDAEGAAAHAREATAELGAAERAVVAAEAAAAAEEGALRRIERTVDLAARRAELVDGEPCPLCGAAQHPYAHGAPTEALLSDQQRAARDAAEAVRAAIRRREEARGAVARHRDRAEAARGAEQDAEAERARHAGAYHAALARVGDAGLPAEAEDAEGAAAARLREASTALARAEEAQGAAEERAAAADRARGASDDARREADGAAERHRALEGTARERRDALGRLEEEAGRLGRTRDAVEVDLEAALGFLKGWRAAARRDGPAFRAACAARVQAHLEQEAARDEATRRVATATAEAEAKAALAGERGARGAEAGREAARARARVAEAEAARGGALGGRGADQVEASLREGTAEARRRLDAARADLAEARSRLAAAEQEATAAGGALVQARGEEAAAEDALRRALEALGIDRAALVARLGRGAAWIAQARAAGEREGLAEADAAGVLAERRRLAAEHAAGRPDGDLEGARAREAAAGDVEARTSDALAQAKAELCADQASREEHAALAVRIERQRAVAERWERLAQVIGAADGKRFRVYAQGLALQRLLQEANAHLRELARRYELMRVPGADLELQVIDHDLADEVRTVNGLSGGELFLVSLALALGLASLSTRAVHARTLFIDEGFGTLDRDTLEHAMAALDGLRASGRTIGVISHVPELHERIGVQVTVERVSAGRSRLVLPSS